MTDHATKTTAECPVPRFKELRRGEYGIEKVIMKDLVPMVSTDRGYNDYRIFAIWAKKKIWFVTRMKDNAVYRVVEKWEFPKDRIKISDEVIELTGVKAEEKCPYLLRRVVVLDEENEREIVLLTNYFNFGATTIAAIYKKCWQIELFFKAPKQNLKIKTFVGATAKILHI